MTAVKYELQVSADPTVTRIIPELAKEIGLNQSIVLLQMGFWIKKNNHEHDDEYWTYQSLRDMREEAFCYWTVDTIARTINDLLEQKLLKCRTDLNNRKGDKTRWFALNIPELQKLKSINIVACSEEVPAKKAVRKSDRPSESRTSVSDIRTDLSESQTVVSESRTPISENQTASSENRTTLPEISTEIKRLEISPEKEKERKGALSSSSSTKLKFKFDWRIANDPDGFARYADKSFIDRQKLDFPLAVQAIFEAWLNALKELERAPLASDQDLWEQNREAAIGMAKYHTNPQRVTDYIKAMYTGDDPFWRNLATPMKLSNVAKGLPSWGAAESIKAQRPRSQSDGFASRAHEMLFGNSG